MQPQIEHIDCSLVKGGCFPMNLSLNKAPCPNLVNCICIKNLTFSFFCIIVLLSKESNTGPWLREKGGNFSENSSLYSSAILKLRVLQNP